MATAEGPPGGPWGDDIYGVVRTSALRRIAPHGSYIHADRAVVASLCLQGRFVQAPEVLFFRREHSDRASRAPGWRARAAILDPARASHWRHPVVRVHLECAIGYVSAVTRADLGATDSLRCFAVLGDWALRRVGLSRRPALRAPRVRSRRHGGVWGSSRRRTTRTVE